MLVWWIFALGILVSTGNSHLRLLIGSCNEQNEPSVWHIIGDHKPDKLVLLGDNIYADSMVGPKFIAASPEQLREHYDTLRSNADFQQLVQSVGGFENVYATYDDHDYGVNNGDSTYANKEFSKALFYEFFKVPVSEQKVDGVYSSRIIRDRDVTIKLILLDVRYNKHAHSPTCSILGVNQWAWLERELAVDALTAEGVDLVLLGGGTQMLVEGKFQEETWWGDCAKDRERLLRLVLSVFELTHQTIPTVLLSGDIHAAEISQVPCP